MSDLSKVMYENLLPHEFVERVNVFPVAYLPLGTMEWHGRHLPLGADGIQSRAVFQRLAATVGGVVLPMLFLGPDKRFPASDTIVHYGMDHYSFETGCEQQLAGSAYWCDGELFDALLDAVLANLARAGFKVVVAHGHGPSTTAFSQRTQIFAERWGLSTFTLNELGLEGVKGIQSDHAATNETSLMMALEPTLVDMARLDEDPVPLSIWGTDPRMHASVEYGQALIAANVEQAAQRLQRIVEEIPSPQLVLDYHSVKNLLS